MKDFRDEEPAWVMYAEYIGGGSDKFYETRVDMDEHGNYWLTKRWGRRPDDGGGQIKMECYQLIGSAIAQASDIINEKVLKGYVRTERPYGAGMRVPREAGPDYYQPGDEAF